MKNMYPYKSTSLETAFYFQFVVISAEMINQKPETCKVTLFKRSTDLRTSSNCDRQDNQRNALRGCSLNTKAASSKAVRG